MRAEYYAAVASAYGEVGDKVQAKYYLGVALKIQASDPEVLQVKQKLGGAEAAPKPPVAEKPPAEAQPKESPTPIPPPALPPVVQ